MTFAYPAADAEKTLYRQHLARIAAVPMGDALLSALAAHRPAAISP